MTLFSAAGPYPFSYIRLVLTVPAPNQRPALPHACQPPRNSSQPNAPHAHRRRESRPHGRRHETLRYRTAHTLAPENPSGSEPPARHAIRSFLRRSKENLIARQIRVTRQENALCTAASFDRDAANAFQLYVAEFLGFGVKRAGFLYGRVDVETKDVFVDFIDEPPQQGSEDVVHLLRDPDEEARVDTIAEGLGMRRVGFVLTQAVGRKASETGEYTMSNQEVMQILGKGVGLTWEEAKLQVMSSLILTDFVFLLLP
ncbi:NPL4-like protein 1 [Zea mays]|uniref:NPL4-like protein 1 n=1 Tax=Zea mays TaxID=4577 RepID=A0A1D6Q2Y1_MAIZE|nr:NPL4-like protein 1 [Zea mays]